MKKITIIIAAVATIFTTSVFAQDNNDDAHDVAIKIPEVALLDIEPANNSVTLSPEAPTEAGEFLDFSNATDNSLWLNYSSVVGSTTEPSRKVTVAITNGTVPSGMELYVSAATAATGEGTIGTPVGRVKLEKTATDLVSAIGSCYTETGENYGHQLTYGLVLAGDEDAVASTDFDDATTLTITYTLTDN